MKNNSILDRWRQTRLLSARPIKCSIELTYQCNERCTHCYLDTYKDDPSRKLSLKDWQHVLTELRNAGVLYLDLMGGEAMLHQDFWEILQFGSSAGFRMSMISNGLKIKQDTALKLKQNGMQAIAFSFYSLNPRKHDAITCVKGSHQKLLQAIDASIAAGIQVNLNVLVRTDNYKEVFSIEEWAAKRGISVQSDVFLTPKISGNRDPLEYRLQPEQLEWYFIEKAKRIGKMTSRLPKLNTFRKDDEYVCGAGKLKCAVNVYGELLACLDIREPLGSLLKSSFTSLWHDNPTITKWRSIRNSDIQGITEGAPSCQHCPGNAWQEKGDAFSVTEFSRQVAMAQEKAIRLHS